MRFEKSRLATLPSCYAVAPYHEEGRLRFLFAPDDHGPCLAIDPDSGEVERVWEGPGGTMALVPLPPGREGFLAVQGFNPGFKAEEAVLVHVEGRPGDRRVRTLATLPYLHRFDILSRGGVDWLVCCTVSGHKDDEADWSRPGAILAAPLPADLGEPLAFTAIATGLHRNHGYWRRRGTASALTAADEGVFELEAPPGPGGAWRFDKVLDRMVSDIALCDIDGDGQEELAAIEPFHGAAYRIYRPGPRGYEEAYAHPGPAAFLHVVWGGRLGGRPAFLGGCRAAGRDLFVLTFEDGAFRTTLVESGAGPSNVAVVHSGEADLLAVANREAGEAALYRVYPE